MDHASLCTMRQEWTTCLYVPGDRNGPRVFMYQETEMDHGPLCLMNQEWTTSYTSDVTLLHLVRLLRRQRVKAEGGGEGGYKTERGERERGKGEGAAEANLVGVNVKRVSKWNPSSYRARRLKLQC